MLRAREDQSRKVLNDQGSYPTAPEHTGLFYNLSHYYLEADGKVYVLPECRV